MFRRKDPPANPALVIGMAGLLLAIVVATVTSVRVLLDVRYEQRTFPELLQGAPPSVARDAETLPGELRWQLVFSILVLLVLIATAVAVVLMLRAYLESRRSLAEVTLLSRNILASMDQAVLTTDRDGRLASVNPPGRQLLGDSGDHLGRDLSEVCPRGLPLGELSCEVFRTGEPVYDRDFNVSQGGQTQRLRAECHLLKDEQGHVVGTVLHVRDVTERHLMEERMRRMERFMGLGALAAGLHHEIKNPLGALSLHVQLLQERLERNGDPEVAENLAVLRTEVNRISGVLENFRDFASLDKLDRSPTNIRDTVERIVRLIHPQAERQHVAVHFEVAKESQLIVPLDAPKFEQVVLNLVLNALDEMPEGGSLTLRLYADGQFAHLEVGDTGAGIPEHVQPRLFDPYFTTKSDGSGLGLALCEKVVQQHGGGIFFETSSSGTVFHVVIPGDHGRSLAIPPSFAP
jgi:two-component system, NtrC family, sensor histidine kinase HydH